MSTQFDWSRPREALRYHHPAAGCGYNACELCLLRDAGEYELAFDVYLRDGYAGDTGLPCGCLDTDELERNDGHDTLVDDFAAVFRPAERTAAEKRYSAWISAGGNADLCRGCGLFLSHGSRSCDNCASTDILRSEPVR